MIPFFITYPRLRSYRFRVLLRHMQKNLTNTCGRKTHTFALRILPSQSHEALSEKKEQRENPQTKQPALAVYNDAYTQ